MAPRGKVALFVCPSTPFFGQLPEYLKEGAVEEEKQENARNKENKNGEDWLSTNCYLGYRLPWLPVS